MRKIWKRLVICACIPVFVWGYRLVSDRQQLHREIIRFHVVANSDTPRDQAVKLRVRDAVLESICSDLQGMTDVEAAKAYLRENLPKIQRIADDTLHAAGFSEQSVVSLCEETFGKRVYDTFSLPSGVYESLRIVIGAGQGHNWWCVSFPDLCLPATTEAFADTAAGAGFPETLTKTLTEGDSYEIRFFLLDMLGKVENILHTSK